MKRNDNRQFARIKTMDQNDNLKSIENVSIQWDPHHRLKVYDLSYGGLACSIPDNTSLELGLYQNFQLHLPGQKAQSLVAQVVWKGQGVMGLQFSPLSIEARKAINGFLDPRLKGIDLRAIDRKYFSKDIDCDMWFQGEFGTNVYLWFSGDKLLKCDVELEDFSVTLAPPQILVTEETGEFKPTSREEKVELALQILQPLAMHDSKVFDFIKNLKI